MRARAKQEYKIIRILMNPSAKVGLGVLGGVILGAIAVSQIRESKKSEKTADTKAPSPHVDADKSDRTASR